MTSPQPEASFASERLWVILTGQEIFESGQVCNMLAGARGFGLWPGRLADGRWKYSDLFLLAVGLFPSGSSIEATRGHPAPPGYIRDKSELVTVRIEPMEIPFVIWLMIRMTKPVVVCGDY